MNGVLLHHKGLKKSFTLSIAALQVTEDNEEVVNVSTKIGFDPMSGAEHVWTDLHEDGRLTNKIGKGQIYLSAVYRTDTHLHIRIRHFHFHHHLI